MSAAGHSGKRCMQKRILHQRLLTLAHVSQMLYESGLLSFWTLNIVEHDTS